MLTTYDCFSSAGSSLDQLREQLAALILESGWDSAEDWMAHVKDESSKFEKLPPKLKEKKQAEKNENIRQVSEYKHICAEIEERLLQSLAA